MTADEAWDIVDAAHTGIFTSLRRDGTPVALPLWFVTHDRQIYIRTPGLTKKVNRVRHNPRVSFLVEAGERWVDLVGVHFTGTATVLTPPEELDALLVARSDSKYEGFRMERLDMPKETQEAYDRKSEKVLIRITPDERFIAWDNRRLGLS
jgi:nitroimidazol reductase NimA-like FMN-containing flavoprotein (pyridoxamine 5'-phosphate oxidase superfamily)